MTNVTKTKATPIPAPYMGMKKPRKRTTRKEDAGKYLLDVSKLILGSIVLSIVLRIDLPQNILLTGGIAAVIVSLVVGLLIGSREIKPGNKALKPRKRRLRLRRSKR